MRTEESLFATMSRFYKNETSIQKDVSCAGAVK